MRVVCQSRKRSELAIDDCKARATETAYELNIGMTYKVYGQCLAGNCLLYLIDAIDREGLSHPTWYPAGLFAAVDGAMPSSWEFSYSREKEASPWGVVAVWGYPELVRSQEHFSRLQERKEDAMMVFLRRRAEIELEKKGYTGADLGNCC